MSEGWEPAVLLLNYVRVIRLLGIAPSCSEEDRVTADRDHLVVPPDGKKRVKGVAPSTPTLARSYSASELHPRVPRRKGQREGLSTTGASAVSATGAEAPGGTCTHKPFRAPVLHVLPSVIRGWAWRDSHPRPTACKAAALLLSYTPVFRDEVGSETTSNVVP